mmetsp:Transcript_135444/g.234958  ORF Transcript_135444/g.234958 Transcript_135444/m.234958 type:complete len:265 (-) Transcript_135444:85-879(-)
MSIAPGGCSVETDQSPCGWRSMTESPSRAGPRRARADPAVRCRGTRSRACSPSVMATTLSLGGSGGAANSLLLLPIRLRAFSTSVTVAWDWEASTRRVWGYRGRRGRRPRGVSCSAPTRVSRRSAASRPNPSSSTDSTARAMSCSRRVRRLDPACGEPTTCDANCSRSCTAWRGLWLVMSASGRRANTLAVCAASPGKEPSTIAARSVPPVSTATVCPCPTSTAAACAVSWGPALAWSGSMTTTPGAALRRPRAMASASLPLSP